MVSFSEKWNVLKNKETLSQKFMGTVKPDAPLKNTMLKNKIGETKIKYNHDNA